MEGCVNMATLMSDYGGHEHGSTSTSAVNTWECVQISGDESFGTRLYWSAFKDDNSGFEAFMVEDVARCDDEQRLLNGPEYAQACVEQEIARGIFYFYKELDVEDHYVCDCMKDYGGDCKYPSKYREGGCK